MLTPGHGVGAYVVEETLGGGGMATVYRVRHGLLGSVHALKVLNAPLLADPEVRERFLSEGRIQAQLTHPNIVQVTDVVQAPGVAGLVLEFVDGPSLDAFLLAAGGPLSSSEILAVMLPVLSGVEAAHRRGVVHRDLKPANVMLAPTPRGFVPKLVDFGIARLEAADAGRTRAGSVLGTPHYMSPEQLRSSRDATPASDIFSLGVVLYELACGRPPFEGETDFEVCRRIVEGRYVPPDRCRPGLDTALARAIEVALEPDPGRRFRSCDDMADFLGARVAPSPAAPRGLVLRLAVDGALHTLGREGEAVHFGARPDNDVVIDRPGISGRHARLLDHAGEVQVEDLGSTNGTWLEGRRLAPHAPVPLPHGARVHLGRHVAFTAAAMVLAPPPPSNRAAAGPPAPAPPRRGSVDPRPSPVPFPDIPAAAADVPAPPLASPPERLLARMVDGLCGLAVTLVLLALVDPPGRPSPSLARWQETADFLRTPAASGFHLFLNVFTPLVAAAFLATRGQTPGKVATGLRVEQPDGSRPAFARMLLRELLPTLVMIASPIAMVGDGGWRWALVALGFVDVFFVFGPFHRSLHDRIAGTVVRHVR